MLEPVFLALVNRSLTALWLAAAILVLRFVFRGAPKWTRGVLWALLAVRLVLPFGVQTRYSVYNIAERETDLNGSLEYVQYIREDAEGEAFSSASAETEEDPTAEVEISCPTWVSAVWALGVVGMLLYALASWLRLSSQVEASLPREEGVMVCDDIGGPFILGVFQPRIYLPATLAAPQRDYVLAHERTHLARRDHWWKLMGFLILCVNWFNPALWLCYVLFCRDMELACDERAVQDLEWADHVGYAQALLDCSRGRLGTGPCPLAFGETGIKERVAEVLRRHKPAPWLTVAVLCACGVAAACFLTSPLNAAGVPMSGWIEGEFNILSYVRANYTIDGLKIGGGRYIEGGVADVDGKDMGYKTFIILAEDGELYDLKVWGPYRRHILWFRGERIGPEMKVKDVAWRRSTGEEPACRGSSSAVQRACKTPGWW